MKRLLVTATIATLFALIFSGPTFAQYATPQQAKDWEDACVSEAVSGKTPHLGCPTPPSQTSDISGRPSIPIEQIRARNAAAIIRADNEAAKFPIGAAPAAPSTLQSPLQTPIIAPVPMPAPSVATPKNNYSLEWQPQINPSTDSPHPYTDAFNSIGELAGTIGNVILIHRIHNFCKKNPGGSVQPRGYPRMQCSAINAHR
jgi:hypothetical protein